MSTGSPLQLGPTAHPVVRLNRRVIYVVGAVLIGAFLTGLIAIRAQGSRASERSAQGRTALQPRSQPWFEGVPDQDPTPRSAALDPLASPSTPLASPRLVAAASSTEEPEAQRERRILRAAMSAPISAAAFERGPAGHAARRRPSPEAAAAAPAGIVVPAAQAQAQSTSSAAPGSDTPGAPRVGTKADSLSPAYLPASVRIPVSPYEVKAGTIVPAVMLGAINSDLPGQILGQVQENVYDSDTGEHLLIPQGTRLEGLYDHRIVYGRERVLITWTRLILLSASSLSLKDGMPGTEALRSARGVLLPRSARRGLRAVGTSHSDAEHLPGCLPRVPYVAAPHRRSGCGGGGGAGRGAAPPPGADPLGSKKKGEGPEGAKSTRLFCNG